MPDREVVKVFVKLREVRNQKKISAKEMAKALELKTEAAYYKKESGLIRFSLDEAKIVSEKLGIPIEALFFENNVSEKETGTA